MWLFCIGLILLGVVLYAVFIIHSKDKKPMYRNLEGKHVVVTGGSSGIGKAAAIEAGKLGAHVTIIGRDINKLQQAVDEIKSQCSNQKPQNQTIQFTVCDVTSGFDNINKCFIDLEEKVGPIFMLVNSAGACICGLFEEMKIEDIHSMISLNYLGSALPTRWVLPNMRKRDEGIVVFVASEAAMVGIYGYSAYSAGKWAIRGLAEAVSMELVGTRVQTMISYPPDTDTPGLKQENETKPEETKLISGSAGLYSPEVVGKALIHDALQGKAYSVYSTSGILLNSMYGLAFEGVPQLLAQIFLNGVFRAIMVGIFTSFHSVIRCELKKKTSKKIK